MKIPCAACGRQFDHFAMMRSGGLMLCATCHFLHRDGLLVIGKKPFCFRCRNEFSPGELIIHNRKAFCKECLSVMLALKNNVRAEEIGPYKHTDEILVEIMAWRMIFEAQDDDEDDAEEEVPTTDNRRTRKASTRLSSTREVT
jgi:DNA-directed RNA polymerase subunit RPC12/RpoP